jgi:hypothetical protein
MDSTGSEFGPQVDYCKQLSRTCKFHNREALDQLKNDIPQYRLFNYLNPLQPGFISELQLPCKTLQNKKSDCRLQNIMKVFIFEITVFWDLMACSLVYRNQYLRNTQNPIWVEDQANHRYGYGGGTRIGVLRGPI